MCRFHRVPTCCGKYKKGTAERSDRSPKRELPLADNSLNGKGAPAVPSF